MLLATISLLAAPAAALPGPATVAASSPQAQIGARARGGPGVAAPSAPTDISRYVESAFGHVDPYPTDFHPLGSARTTLLRRDESVAFFDTDLTRVGVRREDAGENRATNGAVNFGAGGHRLLNATSGDLFGTGRSVAVTASLLNGDPWLRIWDTDAQGDPFVALEGRISATNHQDVNLACGDFDGDGRDEVAVAVWAPGSAYLYVFEDAIDGNWSSGGDLTRLVTRTPQWNSQIRAARVCAAQLDDDDEMEFAFSWHRSFTAYTDVYDDLPSGATLLDQVTSPSPSNGEFDESVAAIRLHDDGIDSLVIGSRGGPSIVRLDVAAQTVSSLGAPFYSPQSQQALIGRPCPFDHDGDGIDELLFVECDWNETGGWWNPGGSEFRIHATTFEFDGGTSTPWSQLNRESVQQGQNPSGFTSAIDIEVTALDEDMDGDEEYRALVGINYAFGPVYDDRINRFFEFGGDAYDVDYLVDDDLDGWQAPRQRLAIVSGDDDGEGTVLRWTGHKENVISEPMPVMVIEAVPTRAGVGQNIAGSSASFTQGSGASQTISTRVALSASLTAGVTTPDLFGVAEAQATATISAEVARTTGTTEAVRTFVTQTAGPDAHAIVFQGTLYTQYHYEVLSAQDPAAVGTTYALNVPVATEQWRWPLPLFNSVFPPRAIDPGAVFASAGGPTVVGDPATYATEAELTALVSGSGAPFTGWAGASANVGQGSSGSTTFGLDLSTVSTTQNELTTRVELGADFKVGGSLFGASVGVSNSWLYEVQTSSDATFSGTIGDLPAATYSAYDYKAGIVVYEDDVNSPVPFRVMRFWTDPRGSAYP